MNHLTQLTGRIALLATCLGAVAVTQAQDFNGPRVFLQATRGGHFMAWGGGGGAIFGNSPNRFAWEEIEVRDLNGGGLVHGDVIGLRTANTRQFMTDNGGGVAASATVNWCYGWELYTIRRERGAGNIASGDRVSLQGFHGQYLGVNYHNPDAPVGCFYGFGGWGSWESWTYFDKNDNATNRNNCVLYARSRVPSLPYGLDSLASKMRIMNERNINAARPGYVAIIDSSAYGHVAVVEQNHGDGTITIREGNAPANTIRSRRGTPTSLKVKGYFRP